MKRMIEGILQGDESSVAQFYTTYSPPILKYLLQKLPAEEGKEILNDVFLDAIDNIASLKVETNLKAWLYRLAHNKVVDYYRKQKLKSVILSQLPFLEILDTKFNDPEFILEKNRVRDRIEHTMLSLSDKYKRVLILHYEERLPVKDIALVLNLSPKATESLLFRARQSFIKTYGRA